MLLMCMCAKTGVSKIVVSVADRSTDNICSTQSDAIFLKSRSRRTTRVRSGCGRAFCFGGSKPASCGEFQNIHPAGPRSSKIYPPRVPGVPKYMTYIHTETEFQRGFRSTPPLRLIYIYIYINRCVSILFQNQLQSERDIHFSIGNMKIRHRGGNLRKAISARDRRGADFRTDLERRRKRTRQGPKCLLCTNFGQRGWAQGFCQKCALQKGCKKPPKKSKAQSQVERAVAGWGGAAWGWVGAVN